MDDSTYDIAMKVTHILVHLPQSLNISTNNTSKEERFRNFPRPDEGKTAILPLGSCVAALKLGHPRTGSNQFFFLTCAFKLNRLSNSTSSDY